MKEKGLTLTEMMFVVAIISIIVVGLNSFFVNTIQVFWKTENQIEVHREAELAKGVLTDDLREARKATVNNMILNPGFMDPLLDIEETDTEPTNWQWWEEDDGTPDGSNIDYVGPTDDNFSHLQRHGNVLLHTVGANQIEIGGYDPQSVRITNLSQTCRYECRADSVSISQDATGIIFGGWVKAGGLNFGSGLPDNDTHLRLVAQLNNDPTKEYYIDWPLEFDPTYGTYFIVPYQYVEKELTEDEVGEISSVRLIGRISGAGGGVVYFDNFYLAEITGGDLDIRDGDSDVEQGEGSFEFKKCVDPKYPTKPEHEWETYTMDRTWGKVENLDLVKRINRRGSGYKDEREKTPRFTPSKGGVEVYIPFNKETGKANAPLEIKTHIYPRTN